MAYDICICASPSASLLPITPSMHSCWRYAFYHVNLFSDPSRQQQSKLIHSILRSFILFLNSGRVTCVILLDHLLEADFDRLARFLIGVHVRQTFLLLIGGVQCCSNDALYLFSLLQQTPTAPEETKGRRSAGRPKMSRIMKDVQESEALLKVSHVL